MNKVDVTSAIREILRDALQLSERADLLQAASPLFGAIPEFDSMAVVTVLTMIEDEFEIEIADEEISADIFLNVATLTHFVEKKTGH